MIGHGSFQAQAHVWPACAIMSDCIVLVPFGALFGDYLKPFFFHSFFRCFWDLYSIFWVIVWHPKGQFGNSLLKWREVKGQIKRQEKVEGSNKKAKAFCHLVKWECNFFTFFLKKNMAFCHLAARNSNFLTFFRGVFWNMAVSYLTPFSFIVSWNDHSHNFTSEVNLPNRP